MSNFFDNVPLAPANPILGLAQVCNEDTHPNKINLTLGAYRDEGANPWYYPLLDLLN